MSVRSHLDHITSLTNTYRHPFQPQRIFGGQYTITTKSQHSREINGMSICEQLHALNVENAVKAF